MTQLFTSQSLWKDFDPKALPLDSTLIKTETNGNVTLKHFYFNGRKIDNQLSRVYAVVACVQDGAIHDGLVVANKVNLGIDVDTLCYWANLGYTAIGIDYAGEGNEENANDHFTVYPQSIDYCNWVRAGRHRTHADYSAKETVWYEYALDTMRAITFLTDEMDVKGRLYLYSVGNASKIAIHTVATDSRLTSACVLFGRIWEDYEEIDTADVDLSEEKDQIVQDLIKVDEQERWLSGICPQSYLTAITKPLFVVIGSNSTFTSVDDTVMAMPRIANRNSRCFIMPRILGTVTAEVKRNVNDFFRNKSIEKSAPSLPKVSVSHKQGKIVATVKCPNCDKISVYYSRAAANNHNWVSPVCVPNDNGVTAVLEIYDESTPVKLYANATYGKLTISSDVTNFVPKDISTNITLLRSTKIVYVNTMGIAEFNPIDVTVQDFRTANATVEYKTGALNISGVAGTKFGTFALSESKIIRNEESVLTFDVFSETQQNVNVYIVQNYTKDNQCKYVASVNLLGGALWQKVTIEASDFKTESGETLEGKNVTGLDLLAFDAKQQIIVNNILYT